MPEQGRREFTAGKKVGKKYRKKENNSLYQPALLMCSKPKSPPQKKKISGSQNGEFSPVLQNMLRVQS